MHDAQFLEDSFGGRIKLPAPTATAVGAGLFVAIKEHLYSDLNGEAVILNMKNGKYYGLNGVGKSIWNAVKDPVDIAEIHARVMNEYEVDERTCRREISSFLEKMLGEGLIEIFDAKAV